MRKVSRSTKTGLALFCLAALAGGFFLLFFRAQAASAATTIFFLNTEGNAINSTIAIDAAGGVHIASAPQGAAKDGVTYPAYYAYCASTCGSAANWTILNLENIGYAGGYVRLILDSSGHPRMVWTRGLTLSQGEYRYAECNTQCNDIQNWTVGSTGSSYYADNSHYFALDHLNRPRLIYDDDMSTLGSNHLGTFYRYCDAACTDVANWHEVRLTTDHLFRPSLAFTSSGQPRFMAESIGNTSREVRYYECNAGCASAANWSYITLTSSVAASTFSLSLDSSDRPRLAFYTGNRSLTDDNLLEYYWCDANCAVTDTNWDGYGLGLDARYGVDADLVFDSQDRPNLAFYVDTSPFGLIYYKCTADCETLNAAWVGQFIETAADLNAIQPVPIKPGCSISSWYPGQKPSLALSNTDKPYFVYDAQHLQAGTCLAHTDITLARFMLDTTALGGNSYSVYLPSILR